MPCTSTSTFVTPPVDPRYVLRTVPVPPPPVNVTIGGLVYPLPWFTGVTLTAKGALIYNTSNSNSAVCVLDFGGNKTATAGTFTIQFPAFTTSAAILRLT